MSTSRTASSNSMFEQLTEYIEPLKSAGSGEWIERHAEHDDVYELPYVVYPEPVNRFVDALYDFSSQYPEYDLDNYISNMQRWGYWPPKESAEEDDAERAGEAASASTENTTEDSESKAVDLTTLPFSDLSAHQVVTLLFSVVRKERFCDGAVKECLDSGFIKRCLQRLLEIDSAGRKQ